jgi:hypothetical protein
MKWLMKKLFGEDKPMRVYSIDQRTPEQEEMFHEQRILKDALGMEHGNDYQNWLRLHQILMDYEERLKKLEGKE